MDIDPRLRHFRENLRRKISKKFLGNKIWGILHDVGDVSLHPGEKAFKENL